MPIITINNKKISCENGDNLYNVLLQNNFKITAPCGGKGRCGKCKVFIEGIGTVKSCNYYIDRDITVDLTIPEGKILATGTIRDITIDNNEPCIAVDIGTTTVVAYLINNGKIVDYISQLNSQKPYGDDVISRINYTIEHKDGTNKLHSLISDQIDSMAKSLIEKNEIFTDNIALCGNTTMMHLFANVSPASIGLAPYKPAFTELKTLGNNTLLPSISGYVGSDTVTAILASGMHLNEEISLLVDIGTNGEIALGNRDKILTCSAAAGPAFEGAQISCGVGGISGAINSIIIDNDEISYSTINAQPAIGICGSAVFDCVAQMLDNNLVDETGYFEDEILNITKDISITANDIRQIQLAKAAIAAGINTLIKESNISVSDIQSCYIAGGFGSYLNKESAVKTGLLPKELLHKIISIGNAAGMGAYLWQVSDKCKQQTQKIKEITEYIELSNSSVFNEEFINCMTFE